MNKLFHYIRPYSLSIVASFLLAIISTVSKLYLPILIGKAIDCMLYHDVNFVQLIHLCKIMVIMVMITAISQWAMNLVNNYVTYHTCKDIRNEAFDKIMHLPLSYLDRHPYGEITNKVINDVDTFCDGLLMGFTNFFTALLSIIGTIIFMLRISPKITLYVLVLTPLSLLAARFVTKNTYNLFTRQSEIKAQQSALIDETIQNQKLVQAFHQQQNMEKSFNEVNNELTNVATKAIFFSSLTNPSTRVVNAIVYAVIALKGAFVVISNGISVGELSSFLSYATQYTKPFNEISDVVVELQNAIACGNRVFQLIDELSEISDENCQYVENLDGDIDLNNVHFGYEPDKPILNGLNFKAYKGHKVAIVGTTGCGKTTLINLLMRFYDADSGSIQIDGNQTIDLKRDCIRSNFGMVLQDSWLKKGTIKENLLFAKADATDEEIQKACKKVYIHNFIMRLPQGYDTVIGDSSVSISAGQQQLLCIARIMLANPHIIVLDEATSAIDTRTELKVQAAFDQLTEGRTAFIVAHRLSTIKNADVIIVMDQGKIIEYGNHQQLLAKNGFYSNLYNSQFAH